MHKGEKRLRRASRQIPIQSDIQRQSNTQEKAEIIHLKAFYTKRSSYEENPDTDSTSET